MTVPKSLPARPSLEPLRKQAKRLARDIAVGDAGAVARARMQLPDVDLPLMQRNAQLVIAREYVYAGWQDLTAERYMLELDYLFGAPPQELAPALRTVVHDQWGLRFVPGKGRIKLLIIDSVQPPTPN